MRNIRFRVRSFLRYPRLLLVVPKGMQASSEEYWKLEAVRWRSMLAETGGIINVNGLLLCVRPQDVLYSLLLDGQSLEPHTDALLQRLAVNASLFVDVGANIGWYALSLATRVKRVVAFEPEPDNFQLMRRSVAKNGFNNIELHQIGIASYDGNSSLSISGSNPGGHSMIKNVGAASITVPVRTLDTLFPTETIDLLKIDVEGGEMEVLAGARRLLNERRVHHIVIEWNPEVWQSQTTILDSFTVHLMKEIFNTNAYLRPKS